MISPKRMEEMTFEELLKECEKLKQLLEPTEEICPHCDTPVNLPPHKGIYECPNCGKLIVCCSMCEDRTCIDCKYCIDEELQAEKQKVGSLESQLKSAEKHIKDLNDIIFQMELDTIITDKYKQALEEIKKIATDLRTRTDYHSEYEVNADIDKILEKCEVYQKSFNNEA